ncbi:hypothetical protein [Seonamhaeicola aphaedonensis]|uniref:Immunity protein 17 of polymorphic toxin system n=1 Tax=Seonamhaeicola aphaedonensis TaxID=1461338 RepID=A0A3D9HIF7_9FLAO|nr:hypothetical protein [Seonamhaeicola aphaedonensis]RED49322.1 hypothetical protein DFQ02_10287 [Seonamhaeicola aphaedonensis]
METVWLIIIPVLIFLMVTVLFWKFFDGFYKRLYSKKLRDTWGSRAFYWSNGLFFSGGVTVLIIYILQSINIL